MGDDRRDQERDGHCDPYEAVDTRLKETAASEIFVEDGHNLAFKKVSHFAYCETTQGECIAVLRKYAKSTLGPNIAKE